MSTDGNDLKVYLYQNDYNKIRTDVCHHSRIETGGNLFGLWTTSGNVVVHVVLGPGRKCERTNVSFHQDIPYMKRVGEFLNQKFMLCHVGEWHSHHQLSLTEPSSGDKRTVRDNYPQGMKKFLVIIANIVGSGEILLSPYFFMDNGLTCKKGTCEVLEVDSPFTSDATIANELQCGAESPPYEQMRNDPTASNNPYSQRDYSSAKSEKNSRAVHPSSDHPLSYENPTNGDTNPGDPSTVSQLYIPPRDYKKSSLVQQNTGNPPAVHQRPYNSPPPYSPPSSSQVGNDESKNQTRQEIVLKKVYDEIQSRFNDPGIAIERDRRSGQIEMKFKHKYAGYMDWYWLIRFPKDFPEKPAKLFCCNSEAYLLHNEYNGRKPEVLNNHINILLTIKRKCTNSCSSCKEITVESLTRTDADYSCFLTEKGMAVLTELCTQIESTIADPRSLKKEIKSAHSSYQSSEAVFEVSFEHCSKIWAVKLTSAFPRCSAEVTVKSERSSVPVKVYLDTDLFNREDLDPASTILRAIKKKCSCVKCNEMR